MRTRQKIIPTDLAWAFIGFGVMWFLIGSGWSVSQAKVYQLELAEYKLAVGSALSEVKKVSDTLEKSADSSAIAPQDKREIEKLTEKTDAVLERVADDIKGETEKLIYLETEN